MGPARRSLNLALAVLAFLASTGAAGAQDPGAGAGRARVTDASLDPLEAPGDVYANIPARDDRGRDQHAMFREWNPDPVGRHEANLAALDPSLARVVRKAQADNPGLRFVIGSGRRDDRLQGKAVAWGWSRTRDSRHRSGQAVDLWPLDAQGRVTFDPASQGRIGAAMRRAAAQLQVRLRWGGGFRGYRDSDRSHFELAPH